MKFTELDLDSGILDALSEMGYTELTPVQEKTVQPILEGRDLRATAETGSGKTSACAVPLIQRIDPALAAIQALIIVPTRELALQYVDEIGRVAKNINVVPFAVYGGFDMGVQKAKLQNLVHVLVATPGRLIDLIYRGEISLSKVQTLVLDEADEMMKEGFLEDIDFVFSCMIHEHQTLLFSATMPPEIQRLVETYLKDPVTVVLNKEQIAPQSLVHTFQFLRPGSQLDTLKATLNDDGMKQAIIFCNSRHSAERLFSDLKGKLDGIELIHGGMEQSKRTSVIRRLRNRRIQFIVATDLAGRGLDFSHVSHVINYDLPRDPVTYTHRTGRAGRMGRTGTAVTYVTRRDMSKCRRIVSANNIDPIWIGEPPQSDGNGRGGGNGNSGGRGGRTDDRGSRSGDRGSRSDGRSGQSSKNRRSRGSRRRRSDRTGDGSRR